MAAWLQKQFIRPHIANFAWEALPGTMAGLVPQNFTNKASTEVRSFISRHPPLAAAIGISVLASCGSLPRLKVPSPWQGESAASLLGRPAEEIVIYVAYECIHVSCQVLNKSINLSLSILCPKLSSPVQPNNGKGSSASLIKGFVKEWKFSRSKSIFAASSRTSMFLMALHWPFHAQMRGLMQQQKCCKSPLVVIFAS